MKTVQLHLKKHLNFSYPIQIGSGILDSSIIETLSRIKPSSIALVMDTNLDKKTSELWEKLLSGRKWVKAVFPAGEENKNLRTIESLFSVPAKAKLDRKALIIACGGGVTGDMAGFLASIYLRGISFIQIPTSLLSMVDSSVGGKTGVDAPEGKNLIGSFYQPKTVIIDTEFLKSLPRKEFTNGMAEVIKHAAILDKSYFEFLTKYREAIDSRESSALEELVFRSVKIKAGVVQKDDMETGLRQLLNFGHTLGHAVEQASDFKIPHGFAVALGMVLEGFIGVQKGFYPESEFLSLRNTLKSFGLLEFQPNLKEISTEAVLSFSQSYKKNSNGQIKAVLLEKNGKAKMNGKSFSWTLTEQDIREALDKAWN